MDLLMSTNDFPASERFDRWRETINQAVAPIEITANDPEKYHVEMRGADFGGVLVSTVASSSSRSIRSESMIRRSDPDTAHLVLVHDGRSGISQNSNESITMPGDLVLYGSWRPSEVLAMAGGQDFLRATLVILPYSCIPFPRNKMEQLAAKTLSGRTGVGSLLANYLVGLTADADFRPTDAPRLGGVLTDLLAALLAHSADTTSSLPLETRQQALFIGAQAFIRQNLGDPALTPAAVAEVHHISIRSLQRLFHEHGYTIAGWIRQQRLEQCRLDLRNPQLHNRSVHALAARWGMTDPAHFSRAFRSAYGLPPGEYRARAVETAAMAHTVND